MQLQPPSHQVCNGCKVDQDSTLADHHCHSELFCRCGLVMPNGICQAAAKALRLPARSCSAPSRYALGLLAHMPATCLTSRAYSALTYTMRLRSACPEAGCSAGAPRQQPAALCLCRHGGAARGCQSRSCHLREAGRPHAARRWGRSEPQRPGALLRQPGLLPCLHTQDCGLSNESCKGLNSPQRPRDVGLS